MLDWAKVDTFYVVCEDDKEHLTYLQAKFNASRCIKDGCGFVHTLITSAVDDERRAVSLLKNVLALGIDPELENDEGDRPSHVAGECGLVEMATVLGMCRVDMSAKNRDRLTPIDVAKAVSDEEGWVRNKRDDQPVPLLSLDLLVSFPLVLLRSYVSLLRYQSCCLNAIIHSFFLEQLR
jgi:hypothetical protein